MFLLALISIYPTILHEAEVRKVIASIKSQNHLHNLSLVRSPSLSVLMGLFDSRPSSIQSVSPLYHTQGLSQHNADWVYQHGPAFEQEVDRFVATYADSPCQDAQEFITQAQARRFFPNRQLLLSREEVDLTLTTTTSCMAHATRPQALLERYRTEGPQIHQTQLIDQEISKFKSTNNMHYLQMVRDHGVGHS